MVSLGRSLALGGFVALLAALASSPARSAEPDEDLELLKTFRQEFIELTPGQGKFPAEFKMGRANGPTDEQPPHTVKLARPFAIARYEVPQNLWQAVMGNNPSRWKGPRNSVELLSYHDAQSFCLKVTDRLRAAKLIGPKQIVRLPSEAEWEYAARAGTSTLYSFGDDPAALDEHGWSTHNAAGNDPPVGSKKPNAWNLYDVHGYLWEWCEDSWHPNYQGAPPDASVWIDWKTKGAAEDQRVLRGGSWKDPRERLTSTARRPAAVDLKDDAVGLRCVLSENDRGIEISR